MKIVFGDLLPAETPIDDITGLKVSGISTRKELSYFEAANIRKPMVKYFLDQALSREIAKFDLTWALDLHREMFGDVWDWAGQCRTRDMNLGCH